MKEADWSLPKLRSYLRAYGDSAEVARPAVRDGKPSSWLRHLSVGRPPWRLLERMGEVQVSSQR